MKILFIGRVFDGVAGGLERMAILLMNAMRERGNEISLLTWDQQGAQTHYPLDPAVDWRKLSMGDAMQKASWRLRWQRQVRIRAIVKSISPDVIIAYQHGAFLAVRMAIWGLGIPIIASERNAPHRFDYLRDGRFRNFIYLSFLFANRITVQFDSYRDEYPRFLHSRIVPIPNSVSPVTEFASPQGEPGQTKILLFVGHLAYQKNPEVLIDAFSIVANRFPDWNLHMVGKGEYQSKLEALVKEKGLASRVQFLGAVQEIEKHYLQAHLFCLPSRWEGYPNALAEALAHGVPSVGFSDCAGLNKLIAAGINGDLAPGNGDSNSLAQTLETLMASSQLRHDMGLAARKSVLGYETAPILERWERLFTEAAKGA